MPQKGAKKWASLPDASGSSAAKARSVRLRSGKVNNSRRTRRTTGALRFTAGVSRGHHTENIGTPAYGNCRMKRPSPWRTHRRRWDRAPGVCFAAVAGVRLAPTSISRRCSRPSRWHLLAVHSAVPTRSLALWARRTPRSAVPDRPGCCQRRGPSETFRRRRTCRCRPSRCRPRRGRFFGRCGRR